MTTEEKLERFVALAAKTGRMYVATDVYESFKKLPASSILRGRLNTVSVVHCSELPPGEVLAADLPSYAELDFTEVLP